MTTAGEGSTLTAMDLLFDPDTDAAGILAGEIWSPDGDQDLGRALEHLPEATRKAAMQQAAITAAALLKVDLIDVLVRGWREHRAIASAARRTLAAPASTELVSMSAHEITLDQRPSVNILVDGQRVATLQLGLFIVFDVNALLLLITGGRLAALHSGRCEITATLAVQGTDLPVRQAHLDLPGVIPLRRGIRLLPIGEYPAGEYPPDEYPPREYPAEYTGSEPRGGEYTGSEPRGGEYTGSEPRDGEYTGGEPRGGEYTGSEPRGGEYTGSEPRDGEYTGGGYQGSEYPAEMDGSPTPGLQSARWVTPPDHRT